eukprot:m.18912 g.18912  ORF g.18912 m.18912 type:complete len:320 (-) comp3386_c0_seq1:124-1083(-)
MNKLVPSLIALGGVAIVYLNHQANMSLATVRAKHAAVSLAGKTAIVVGGTAGIGAGIAQRLAQADASVVIVGRSKQRGEEMVKTLSTLSKTAKHEFIPCDGTLLGNVATFSKAYAAGHERLDYLVLTQGIATTQGRTETAEGIDEKMSLHYYSRMAYIRTLLPLLERADDPRVLTVLSAGVHKPYTGYSTDPELKTTYSLANAAYAAGFYNDIAVESLALEHPAVSFIHAAPGTINTNWGTELPLLLRGLVRMIQPFMRSLQDCGEYMASALMDPEYHGGWSLMDQNGNKTHPTALQAEARAAVWASTQAVLDRVLPPS